MRKIKKLQDVIDWNLCVGCGACFAFCDKKAIRLEYFENIGIRPLITNTQCAACNRCLIFCPGYTLKLTNTCTNQYYPLVGHYQAIYEGFATNEAIRFKGSSGGAITALAAFCLHHERIDTILHTGMDKEKPWQNITVQSHSLEELQQHSGSRYTPSSPCDMLPINNTKPDQKLLFIGKPCDVAAVSQLKNQNSDLEKKIQLSISFFCAGTPSHTASLKLLDKLGVSASLVKKLIYRGDGWPGGFQAFDAENHSLQFMPYLEAWSFLEKHRSFRCHICPDGLGEYADITCGDAWHKYNNSSTDPGRSIIIARTLKGKNIVEQASLNGYLVLEPLPAHDVIKAQGLVRRREELYGRIFAMKMLLIPTPCYMAFPLKNEFKRLPRKKRIKIVFATLRRLTLKKLWKRRKI